MPEHALKYGITLDPNQFFRDGMESCLVKAGHGVLGHTRSFPEALRVAGSRTPDLAGVGPNFPEPEAFVVCRELLARWPNL